MMQDDCSRRVFLKKFAFISAGALMLSATAMACYGPMSPENAPYPQVSDVQFMDALNHATSLQGVQTVPVHTVFLFVFTKNMNTAISPTIQFNDQSNVAVVFSETWYDSLTLSITPNADLSSNTGYTIGVGNDAEDSQGNKIFLTAKATATFKTA